MLIPHDEILRTFRKVKAVREHMRLYHVGNACHQFSVESFQDTVADMYGLRIEKWEVLTTATRVAGNVERYEDGRAVILVRADLSDAMKRFVAVKELCHLMIDEDDDWSSAGVETVQGMKVELDLNAAGEGVTNPTRTQKSEMLAWLAAIELMYPCEFHGADKEKLDEGETTVAQLGLYHDMPPHILEAAFRHPDVFALYDTLDGSKPSAANTQSTNGTGEAA
jgi:hypothetical protein